MTRRSSLVVLDGANGEGGGGLIRTALSLAALTQQGVRIDGVRGGTQFPGVDVEDLALTKVLADLCDAETPGLELRGHQITFLPTRAPRALKANIPDTDSARQPNALVLASSLAPTLARTGALSRFECHGETFAHNSLSYDYYASVALRLLKAMGIYVHCELIEASFDREAPGTVRCEVEPSALKPIHWETRGGLKAVRAMVTTSGIPDSVGQRGIAHMRKLGQSAGLPIEVSWEDAPSPHPGAFVTCWAEYQSGLGGATAMGNRGIRIEMLAQNAFDQLTRWMSFESTVDPFLADQILIPGVFADGDTVFRTARLTQRFLTQVWVIKQFLPIHITVQGKQDEAGTVTIRR